MTEALKDLVGEDADVVEFTMKAAVDVTWLELVLAIIAMLVPVLVVPVLPVVTLPLAWDVLLDTEALEVPLVDGAVVMELSVEVAANVPLLELVLAIVAVVVFAPALVVTVLLAVTLPLPWAAPQVNEAL